MNPTLKQYWLTTLLVGICIILYVIQVLTGVDAGNPTSTDLLKWGANWLFYSFDTQQWRMFTSVFLHVGFMHLAFNTYALYLFGQTTEYMLGRWFYLALFILSGIGGNMMNNSYTTLMIAENGLQAPIPVSAGASGGIMGLGAALLVFALLKVQPKGTKLHLKTLMWIMGINLSLGFIIPGIDNAAHIGGALTGAIMAFIYSAFYKQAYKYGNRGNQQQVSTLNSLGKVTAVFTVSGIWFSIYQFVMANHTDTIQQIISQL